jgi:hypothetical protein
MVARARWLLLACAAAPVPGCGDPSLEVEGLFIDGAADCPGCPPSVLLDGDYLLVARSDVVGRELDGGEERLLSTSFRGVATLVTSGADATLRLRPCRIGLPRTDDLEPTLSPRLLEAVAPISSVGLVGGSDGVLSLGTDPAALVLGATLADQLASPLPQDEDDPAALDQDADGEPGVTIEARGFEIYVALRVAFSLLGTTDPNGTIAGSAMLEPELQVLGDDIPFIDAREELDEAMAETEVVSETSRFVMVRLPQGTSPSCAATASMQSPL